MFFRRSRFGTLAVVLLAGTASGQPTPMAAPDDLAKAAIVNGAGIVPPSSRPSDKLKLSPGFANNHSRSDGLSPSGLPLPGSCEEPK